MLGAGAMGTVYRVRDRELDEVVALKMLRHELVGSPEVLRRFRREVKLARRVTHPNVARTFDIGQHEDDRFLTMEYVDGHSLSAVAAREGRLPTRRVTHVLQSVCRGLSAAHEAGVVHRDLKPENVMLGNDGRIVITDFGVACVTAEQRPVVTQTSFVGTPMYMAPEQVEGGSAMDARTDVYALGAMMYQLLTGEPPWMGRTLIAVAMARLSAPAPDPRHARASVPEAAARIVTRCMEQRAEDRFESAAEVARALEALEAELTHTPSIFAPPRLSDVSAFAPLPTSGGTPTVLAGRKTLAVLPFHNRGAADQDYVADELTEDIIDTLSMVPSLKLRPYSAVAAHRGTDLDAQTVGRELGVQVVVAGTVQRVAGDLRITTRLLTTEDGFQLWAKRFQRPVTEILEVSDEAARAIAERLTVDLAVPGRKAPTSPQAMEFYLKGRAALRHVWLSKVQEAAEWLGRARELAPDDPSILCGYARATTRLWFWSGSRRHEAHAIATAERAAELAPDSAEARLALAGVRFMRNEHGAALSLLKAAIARSPSLAEARELLGRILLEVGRIEDGLAQLRAAETLDARLPQPVERARGLALLGRWDEAFETVQGWSDAPEELPARAIVCARLALWSPDRQRFRALLPPVEHVADPGRTYVAIVSEMLQPEAMLTDVHRAAFQDYFDATRGSPRFSILVHQLAAEVYAFGGDRAAALQMVREAVDEGLVDLGWLDRCPVLAPLRDDAGFQAARGVVEQRLSAVWAALDPAA